MLKLRADFAFTNDTSYSALTGELWGEFREIVNEKWPRYIESAQMTVLFRERTSCNDKVELMGQHYILL